MSSEHNFGKITVSQAELERILKESAEEHALLVRECAERGISMQKFFLDVIFEGN